MMARNTFMVGQRLHLVGGHGFHIVEVGVVNARPRAVFRRSLVEGLAGGPLAEGFHALDDDIGLGQ